MRGFAGFLISIFILTSIVSAQSGRKITPQETPTPESQPEEIYSESKTVKKRPIYIPQEKREERKIQTGEISIGNLPEPATTEDDDEIVKIESNLVTIPVSVFDRNGLYIPSLQKSDFKIFENGEEQEIALFGTTDKPFTVILLLDTSPSTEYKIEEIQTAAKAFVDQLKPQDQVGVIEFDGNVHVLTKITNDRKKIFKAIDKADFGGGTSLYDAVNDSLKKHLNKIEGRKAIVLFTDGVDTTSSKSSYDEVILEAEESEAMVFTIYYNTFVENSRRTRGRYSTGDTPEEYALGKRFLDDLSDYTGGRIFQPETTPGGLTRAFEGIAEELRRQYYIGYYPLEVGKVGERRKIKVRVNRPNLVIRARDSYIVGATLQNQASN